MDGGQATNIIYASRLDRLGASTLDVMVAGFSCYVANTLLALVFISIKPSSLGMIIFSLLFFIIVPAGVFFLLNKSLMKTTGQTIGKKAFNLKICLLDGTQAPFDVIKKRYLFIFSISTGILILKQLSHYAHLFNHYVYLPLFIFQIADCIFIFRSDRRCLHDLFAKTIVTGSRASIIDAVAKNNIPKVNESITKEEMIAQIKAGESAHSILKIVLTFEIFSLIPWLVGAFGVVWGVSMSNDLFVFWVAFGMALLYFSYPILVILCGFSAFDLNDQFQSKAAVIRILLPLAVLCSWFLLTYFLGRAL